VDVIESTSVDWQRLLDEIGSIELQQIPDGSGASHFGGPEGWIKGLSMARINERDYPLVNGLIEELRENVQVGELVQIMVNRLAPRASLAPHRDGLPDNARYHFPVVTNDLAVWWDELNGECHMKAGFWYGPVPYCGILHSVSNPAEKDRIHLVVDFRKKGHG
jgi:Aspartyl/Asparaginyl beta-hydroxylase